MNFMISARWLKKSHRKILLPFLLLIILAIVGFWFYVQVATRAAETDAQEAIMEDDQVVISEESGYYSLEPLAGANEKNMPLIYYPGGLVDPEAYLYKMGKSAAELQKNVYILKAPFNAAIFNVNAAGRIMENNDLEQAWIGGHSLGGITACRFVADNPEKAYGLFLFGSYCDRDISNFPGPVISLMGLEDKIVDWENYEQAKTNLPADALILEVEGVNHSDFGNYGLQEGDGESDFTDKQVIELIAGIFENYTGK